MQDSTVEGFGSSESDLCLSIGTGQGHIGLDIKPWNRTRVRKGLSLGHAYYGKTLYRWPISCKSLRSTFSTNQSKAA